MNLSTSNTEVMAGGSPVLLETDQHTVGGCPFQVPTPGGPKPQPCVIVRWQLPAVQSKVRGIGILTQSSIGLCYSAEQIPQGPAVIAATQTQAKGL